MEESTRKDLIELWILLAKKSKKAMIRKNLGDVALIMGENVIVNDTKYDPALIKVNGGFAANVVLFGGEFGIKVEYDYFPKAPAFLVKKIRPEKKIKTIFLDINQQENKIRFILNNADKLFLPPQFIYDRWIK